MKHAVAILLLAVPASISFAQSSNQSGSVTVANAQDCPAGTTANPNYAREGGKFVRKGWICTERINARS
jgi:hypothetical protein